MIVAGFWSEHVSHTADVSWGEAWPGLLIAGGWLVWTVWRLRDG